MRVGRVIQRSPCCASLALALALGACAHARDQSAFGVSAEMVRASANDRCTLIDVTIRNNSARPAFLLMDPRYPLISIAEPGRAAILSFHQHRRKDLWALHRRGPEGIRIPPRRRTFLRIALPLPLQTQMNNYINSIANVSLPRIVTVEIGVIDAEGQERLKVGGGSFSDRVASTTPFLLEQTTSAAAECPSDRITLLRRDPGKGIRDKDILFKNNPQILDLCLAGDKEECWRQAEFQRASDEFFQAREKRQASP